MFIEDTYNYDDKLEAVGTRIIFAQQMVLEFRANGDVDRMEAWATLVQHYEGVLRKLRGSAV